MVALAKMSRARLSRRGFCVMVLAGVASAALGVPPATAQTDRGFGHRRRLRRQRWREMREAVRRGEIRPLREIIRHFKRETGKEIIDIRYRRAGRHHLYGFKTLTDDGRLQWYVVNAATKEIMTPQEAKRRYGQ